MNSNTGSNYSYSSITMEDWRSAWLDHVDGKPTDIDLPPFPSEEVQKITNSNAGRKTVELAWEMYRIFTEEVSRFNLDAQSTPLTVLDLGAGWGRITRLMMRDVAPGNLTAVDVDKLLVDSGAECLPDVIWKHIKAGESLPFADDQFSLVLANSVLSHLDEKLHRGMISEVSRVLKPGGIFLGTTLSERHYLSYLKYDNMKVWLKGIIGNLDSQLDKLKSGEFVYGHSKRLEGYGMTFLPDGWPAENWAPELILQSTRTDYYQDVQVAQAFE